MDSRSIRKEYPDIRIDRNTHLRSGAQHAHIYGRHNKLIGVVRTDGTPSHGSEPFRLHQADADALRQRGFAINANNTVEWTLIDVAQTFLIEGTPFYSQTRLRNQE